MIAPRPAPVPDERPSDLTARAPAAAPARRNHVGTVSLLAAVAGAVSCQTLRMTGVVTAPWMDVLAAGFEAAIVGGLADWFAVTALFRHPLGLPIPHTALISERRDKITEGIVTMVEEEWLSPEVIGSRLAKFRPSALVLDWLEQPDHVARLGGPVRDVVRALARTLTQDEVVDFVDRAIRTQLRELPVGSSLGQWMVGIGSTASLNAAFDTFATSLANLAQRPRTSEELQYWIERSAQHLWESGRRLMPWVLRRPTVQRRLVEAACEYASSELQTAVSEPEHPLRQLLLGSIRRWADRLAEGDADAVAQAERLRGALVESLEASPLVRDALGRLQEQLEHDLDDPRSQLSVLVDRRLRAGILELLRDPERAAQFDEWVRSTVDDLLRRHHHQIGVTVRENLEALDTGALVQQIEDRVGADLQFIRLNGAVVGGLIGLLIALARAVL